VGLFDRSVDAVALQPHWLREMFDFVTAGYSKLFVSMHSLRGSIHKLFVWHFSSLSSRLHFAPQEQDRRLQQSNSNSRQRPVRRPVMRPVRRPVMRPVRRSMPVRRPVRRPVGVRNKAIVPPDFSHVGLGAIPIPTIYALNICFCVSLLLCFNPTHYQ
jgi:hypothetical protein